MKQNPLRDPAMLSARRPEDVLTPNPGCSPVVFILIVLAVIAVVVVWVVLQSIGGGGLSGPSPSPSPSIVGLGRI